MILSLIFLIANLVGYIVVAWVMNASNRKEMARLQRQADAFERLAEKYCTIAENAIAHRYLEQVCPDCGVTETSDRVH